MSVHRRELILAPQAQQDLSDILLQTEMDWGIQQRSRYRRVIDRALAELLTFPYLGRSRNEISPGLRSFSAGRHLIYYRVSESELNVNRIVHPRMELGPDDLAEFR